MRDAYLWLYVLLAFVPFAASVIVLFYYRAWQSPLLPRRKLLWLTGMSLGTAFSLTLPVALCLSLVPAAAGNVVIKIYSMWLLLGSVLVPVAAILVGFGVGRLRLLGLVSTAITGASILFAIAAAFAGMAGI